MLYLAAAAMILVLAGCDKDRDAASPRSPIVQDGAVPQSAIVKVKSDEWELVGTPGDDTYGYKVTKNSSLITAAVLQHGSVHVFLQRSNGSLQELPLLAGQGGPGGVNLRYQASVGQVTITVDRAGEEFSAPGEMLTFKVLVYTD